MHGHASPERPFIKAQFTLLTYHRRPRQTRRRSPPPTCDCVTAERTASHRGRGRQRTVAHPARQRGIGHPDNVPAISKSPATKPHSVLDRLHDVHTATGRWRRHPPLPRSEFVAVEGIAWKVPGRFGFAARNTTRSTGRVTSGLRPNPKTHVGSDGFSSVRAALPSRRELAGRETTVGRDA